MTDRSQIRVAVSGISGFIGAQIAADLLSRKYIVHGTVRSNTPNQVAHLTSLDFPGKLEVFEADMMKDGSFDEPLMGCTYALHVASPYILTTSDPKTDVIEPAIQGTLNFLSACVKASITKVILTSSIGAVADLGQQDKVFDESDWNDEHEEKAIPFYYSKVAAERAAWSYATEKNLKLVVINPSMVLGPSLVPRLNPSNLLIRDIASGKIPVIVDLELPAVDVRDVSEAHIRAMETEATSGRYICTARNLHLKEAAEVARANGFRATRISLTSKFVTEIMRALLTLSGQTNELYPVRRQLGRPIYISNDKIINELGVTFRDMRTTLTDSFNDMIEWGHLHKS
eukprot:TRINITY_DN1021_c0_g1_i7.p1 TRINITY_DN1021_c0_g1~~TRINITY_DN1021_c0_g1_i7.p1  ORF type:complete len:343 (-),score=37.83 TRINITY_DN1021_c0_g1_i7:2557-3585(-)